MRQNLDHLANEAVETSAGNRLACEEAVSVYAQIVDGSFGDADDRAALALLSDLDAVAYIYRRHFGYLASTETIVNLTKEN